MKNPVKTKLRAGRVSIGTFVGIGHPDVTEWLSHLGFDWLLIDAEHSPIGLETIQKMIQSMSSVKGCVPIVRPQWNDPVIIKRVLDIGAYGVLIPWVNSKEDAVAAVRACKYPPEGIRGFGPRRAAMFDPDYFKTANDELLIAVQIETATALKNLDEILSVEGIDACYIGPWDLSCSLGYGVPPKWDEHRYKEAFDKVLTASKKWNKAAGMFATINNINWAIEKGFIFNSIDDDDTFLIRGAQNALNTIKGWTH
ncbi:MAG: 4-hydroxy-2-oxo-heptane-1,7-dioate aldolase [Candidatus Bathyarchaeota archaeon]|nr:MAG: 4-hydroxy-2-oxo-heptane-1,7-dioate aldolase [Candidatus Bathyarchaeota archaeon]